MTENEPIEIKHDISTLTFRTKEGADFDIDFVPGIRQDHVILRSHKTIDARLDNMMILVKELERCVHKTNAQLRDLEKRVSEKAHTHGL